MKLSSFLPIALATASVVLLNAPARECRAQATTNWIRPADGVWYWGNQNSWTNGVPGPGIDAVFAIDYSRAYLDIQASAQNLTLQQRASIVAQQGQDLTVLGTTTLTNPGSGTYTGGEIRPGSGSIFSLGTLANFSNGILTGSYYASDNNGQQSRDPTIIQFHGANVIDNRATVSIAGIDAVIRDQDGGANAFRNLAINNRRITIYDNPGLEISGNLTNNGRFDVWDYTADYEAVQVGTQVTIKGSLVNNPAGYFEVTSGGTVTVNGDVTNAGKLPQALLSVYGDSNIAPVTATFHVKGTLRNTANIEVYADNPGAAKLIVDGNMINSGTLLVHGSGYIYFARGMTVKNGGQFVIDRPVETYQQTAARIDVAAGSQFGATGTVFCDLTTYGIFSVGASAGQPFVKDDLVHVESVTPNAANGAAQATVHGNVILADPSVFEAEIGGAPGTNQNDLLTQVSGDGDIGTRLGGSLALYVINGYETSISSNEVFTILTSDKPLLGAFKNVASGGRLNTADGKGSFVVNYSGNNVTLTGFDAALPPVISDFSPSGVPNYPITINGSAFAKATSVLFNGVPAASYTVNSDTQITAVVPSGATNGPISVSSNSGTGVSSSNFVVLADDDGDGMSNDFEAAYPAAGDPAADTDHDGSSNYAEYLAGTDPLNPASVFRISEIRRAGDDIGIKFPSAANKRYRIEAAGELTDTFGPIIAKLPAEANPNREVIHAGGATLPSGFYRVAVLP